jgi:hypothetical protein
MNDTNTKETVEESTEAQKSPVDAPLIVDNRKPIIKAETIVNFLSIVFAVTLGFLFYVLYYGISGIDKTPASLFIILLILLLGLLMIKFSTLVPPPDKDKYYLVSGSSISTLKSAGVPEDLIESLERIVGANRKSMRNPYGMNRAKPFESSDELLKMLQDRHGVIRTNEFKELILKYTMRDKPSD